MSGRLTARITRGVNGLVDESRLTLRTIIIMLSFSLPGEPTACHKCRFHQPANSSHHAANSKLYTWSQLLSWNNKIYFTNGYERLNETLR